MSKYPEDDRLLEKLAGRDEEAWRKLYEELRSPFRLFFIKRGIPPEDSRMLYQEAMAALFRNCTNGRLQPPLNSTLKTYLFGIGKVLLLKKGNDTSQWDDELPELPIEPVVENRQEQQEKAALAHRLLNKIGEPCKELLEMVYIQGFVMEAVAERLQLPSAGAARKRKFDCLQKLREMV